MKTAAVTMVKNECDIIELFIKINSRVFDFIHVLDHMSDDGTSEIVKRMQDRNYPIKYSLLSDTGFQQSAVITQAVNEIAAQDDFDYIMPLDADEFLSSNLPGYHPNEVIRSCITKAQFGLIPMFNYYPIKNEFQKSYAPLYENFVKRKHEPNLFHKVIVGNEFAKGCRVFEGNHSANNPSLDIKPVFLPLSVQHVPVRSAAQITRKALLGDHALNLKQNKWKGEGFHWTRIAETIRKKDFDLTDDDLSKIARNYMLFNDNLDLEDFAPGAPKIGRPSDTIEFKDLAVINPLKSLDAYIAKLVTLLKENDSKD
jgi:glycosyltransferase involved in cell wall biosynthesis